MLLCEVALLRSTRGRGEVCPEVAIRKSPPIHIAIWPFYPFRARSGVGLMPVIVPHFVEMRVDVFRAVVAVRMGVNKIDR